MEFYQTVTALEDPGMVQFQPFIPTFYGSCTKQGRKFLMIQNATMKMTKPCIMDIKVKCKMISSTSSLAVLDRSQDLWTRRI